MGSEPSLEYCELSDIGRRRSSNQDASAVVPADTPGEYRRRGWLFLVADGMGAHAAGETASRLAKEQVPLAYEKLAIRSPPLAVHSSIEHANRVIHERGETSPDLKGMGTTCSVLAILPRGALVGHVGDSRVYRVRGETIEQLSRDHSLAWEVEAARKREAGTSPLQSPAFQDPPKNIITRSLGPHGHVDIDLEGPFSVATGDVFVLCSDGLSGQVMDEEIGCLAAALPPPEAAAALLGLALVRGAPDNVTLIVARAGRRERSEATAGSSRPTFAADDGDRQGAPRPVPARWFILAAVGLLGALVFNPWADLMIEGGFVDRLLGGLAPPIGTALTGLMALLALAAAFAALLEMMGADSQDPRTFRLGGESPYRSYDCPLTAERVEGIVSCLESAADGLGDDERQRALDFVTAARRQLGSGDPAAALTQAVAGLAVYRRSVEAARGDDPTRFENG